jgi:hypothetical protein
MLAFTSYGAYQAKRIRTAANHGERKAVVATVLARAASIHLGRAALGG